MNIDTSSFEEQIMSNNVEIYEIDPYVATYDNILSKKECEHFITLFKGKINNANTYRISHSTDKLTNLVAERIANIVGMPLTNAEDFQINYYDKGCETKPRYASWNNNGTEKTIKEISYGGPRLVTALCYLNDVEEGGEIKLTKLNTTIPTKEGRLLIFNNTTPDKNSIHNNHVMSEYADLPVIKNSKYTVTLWFRESNIKKLYSETNKNKYDLYISKASESVKRKCISKPTQAKVAQQTKAKAVQQSGSS